MEPGARERFRITFCETTEIGQTTAQHQGGVLGKGEWPTFTYSVEKGFRKREEFREKEVPRGLKSSFGYV